MSWTKILSEAELPVGSRQVTKVGDRKILLINQAGKIHAIDNACPHLKLPLKKAKLAEDGTLTCPWHRSSFDLATGEAKSWCTWPPVMGSLMGKVSEQKSLTVFPVRTEGSDILIDI